MRDATLRAAFCAAVAAWMVVFISHSAFASIPVKAASQGATLCWRGTASALASNPANWVDGDGQAVASPPATGDAIVLDGDSGDSPMTWDISGVKPASWTQGAQYAGTVTFDTGLETFEVAGDVVLSGGSILFKDKGLFMIVR